MSQRCKTCAHPDIREINSRLAGNVPYSRIASDFGLTAKTVERHAKEHVKPLIEAANEAAEQAIVDQIMSHRMEVNYSILDKVKSLQGKIWDDLDAAAGFNERVPLYRELRGALQEEAKLSGAYQQDGKNQSDLERVIKGYRIWEKAFPDAPAETRESWIGLFAEASGFNAADIRSGLGVQEVSEVVQ